MKTLNKIYLNDEDFDNIKTLENALKALKESENSLKVKLVGFEDSEAKRNDFKKVDSKVPKMPLNVPFGVRKMKVVGAINEVKKDLVTPKFNTKMYFDIKKAITLETVQKNIESAKETLEWLNDKENFDNFEGNFLTNDVTSDE